MNSVFFSIAV